MYELQKENENNRTTIAYFFTNQSMVPPIVPGITKLNKAFETFNYCPYVTEPCVGGDLWRLYERAWKCRIAAIL